MASFTLGQTLLEVRDVCLEYQGNTILRNVNANVRDIIREGCVTGQIVGFLGPSGIGKTQLCRIIAGLNQPTSGSVHVNGSDRSVRAGEVGVVAQSYPLLNHRTVYGNLLLSAMMVEKDRKVAHDKVMMYLEEFELKSRMNLYPEQLSGGQRQRVAIIQQVLCSEHFLLMDEPFSGLDLLMLEKTCKLLSRIAHMHEFNTIIVVTHDVTAAASISDHLWMMGRDRDEQGDIIPGARIMREYNLAKEDLCWRDNLITDPRFINFVAGIKEDFRYM